MSYRIIHLFIYPIKGLAGIEVSEAKVLERGLEHDRRMMLVDENGLFLSQRTIPELALYKITLTNDGYNVSHGGKNLHIGFNTITDNSVEVTVWDDKLICSEVSAESSAWFSEMTGMSLKLVAMTDTSERNKRLLVSPNISEVSLADGYPFLLLGSASMNELNARLIKDVSIDRFRANIIIDSSIAHEEDHPLDLETESGVQFRVIKPCARCKVVNIDPKDASISKDVLYELSKYRKEGNKVNFGANMIALRNGIIKVGQILSTISAS